MEITGAIVTYNNIDVIGKCIGSILTYSLKYEMKLYIIDNGSTDGTVEFITTKYPQVQLIKNLSNVGFGAAHNQIIPYLKDGFHFVINPDIYLDRDVISALVDYLKENPCTGMVTPRVLNPDGSEQFLPQNYPKLSYVLLSKLPFLGLYRDKYTRKNERIHPEMDIEFCTGCFFCIRNEIFKQLRGFDEVFFMYFEDADLSKRVNMKFKIRYYSKTSVFHSWNRENTKTLKGTTRYLKSMLCFFKRWGWRF